MWILGVGAGVQDMDPECQMRREQARWGWRRLGAGQGAGPEAQLSWAESTPQLSAPLPTQPWGLLTWLRMLQGQ